MSYTLLSKKITTLKLTLLVTKLAHAANRTYELSGTLSLTACAILDLATQASERYLKTWPLGRQASVKVYPSAGRRPQPQLFMGGLECFGQFSSWL